ncbi:hypothetical protein GCM10017772_29970 [Promicromonospora soli]|uniref:Uncharacterized protein n=1 Tax=Promicromonospora soli TaxID=2035533 RepID=A0A919FZV0_9MICO|nr:hypothetical protein GCM10017772_29970 [Promicromonospora soli]
MPPTGTIVAVTRPRVLILVVLIVAIGGIFVWQPWAAPPAVRLAAWHLEQVEGVASVQVDRHDKWSPVHGERATWSVTTVHLDPGLSPAEAGEVALRTGRPVGPNRDAHVHLVGEDADGVERVSVVWAEPVTAEHVVDAFSLADAGARHVQVVVTGTPGTVSYQVQTEDQSEWERFARLADELGVPQPQMEVG